MQPFLASSGKSFIRFMSITFALAMMIALGSNAFLTPSAYAEDTLEVTHTVSPANYQQGQDVTVTNEITYTGDLSSVGFEVTLPSGWTYVTKGGDDKPSGGVRPEEGLEFYWTEIPDSPVQFTYTVKASASSTGDQDIAAKAKYRRLEGEIVAFAKPDPLTMECLGCVEPTENLNVTHSADANYVPGNNYAITTQIVYAGELSALGAEVDVPTGWTYVSVGGASLSGLKILPGFLPVPLISHTR